MKHGNKKVLEFIIEYKTKHDGNSPTVREIGEATGISSTSVVRDKLVELEALGFLIRGTEGSRGIRLVGGKWIYEGKDV